jgi:hypothetical protein
LSDNDATPFYENKNAQPRSMSCLCSHLPANAIVADSDILNGSSSTPEYILTPSKTESSRPSSSDSTPRSLSGAQNQSSDLTAQALAKVPAIPSPLESYVSNEEGSELIVLGLHTGRTERPVLDPVMLQILDSI